MSKSRLADVQRIFRLILLLGFIHSTILMPTGTAEAAPGVDGDLIISGSGVVVNRYAPVTAVSGNTVTVTDINLLDDGGANHYANSDIAVGDMILIYQAQGATFTDTTDTDSYGAFANNSAGTYEFAVVSSVSGNDITVDSSNNAPYSCGGITGTYDTINGNVQAVRVPQYVNLTINASASIIGNDWNGSTGGVVSVLTQSSLTVNGSIDVSGQGFRGGVDDNISTFPPIGTTTYVTSTIESAAEKGESILGYQTVYHANNGRYGRGAPANGGGGGVNHNSGGGGGANGNNGGIWTGQGTPDTSNSSWDNAWDMDDGTDDGGTPLPGYFTGGAGGGRGGYSYSDTDLDALTVLPGDPTWGGDEHREVGGRGGRPLNNDPTSQLFMGGGGGAGDANNSQGNDGGDGGGLIVITAFNLSGTGQILADGDTVPDTGPPNYADGNGGGGAGGTVVIGSSSVTGVTISADGGAGGNVDDPLDTDPGCSVSGTSVCTVGPGGGGGGGYVHVNTGSGSLTTSVNGGANGVDTSTFISEFPPDGATAGYDGASSTAAFEFPGCSSPTAVSLFGMSTSNTASGFAALPILLLVSVITATLFVWRAHFINPGNTRAERRAPFRSSAEHGV